MEEWIDPNIIIGNKATGALYYPRKEMENNILREIEKGNHILIAAPRRYGKTSIVCSLANAELNGTICIFENIQGLKSETAFYKRIYELILSCVSKNKRQWKRIKASIKGVRIEEVSVFEGKVKFGDKNELDYLVLIEEILSIVEKENIRIVLFIDELPEILHDLNKNRKVDQAHGILNNIREWRQNPQYKSLCLVLTGSIGIHHIVKRIEGRVADINDLNEIKFESFTLEQAVDFINYVTKEATLKYSPKLIEYLLKTTVHLIPFFINLLLDEINRKARALRNVEIVEDDIDNAFRTIVKENKYFVDWKNRIFEYFNKEDALFMNEVLLYIAHKAKINDRQLYDLAVKHGNTINYMDLINILERDGYIHKIEIDYFFVSPFLHAFWRMNQPFYDEK